VSNKVNWSLTLISLVLASHAFGQTNGNGVHIYTEPGGVYFQVDGQNFLSQADLLWPASSKHSITSYDQSPTNAGTQSQYQGYITNLSAAITTAQPITADPKLQWIKLIFATSYLLTIDLINCGATDPTCPTAGTVEIVGRGTFSRHTQIFVQAQTQVEAKAYPSNGFIFTGWTGGYGTAYDIHFVMSQPIQLDPTFTTASPVNTSVSVATDPPQLQVLLDRTPYTPPVSLQWGIGTTHTLGANPLQIARGITYVFDSWSDGGDINHDIQVPSQATPLNFTARFVEPAFTTFATSPAGLSLSVDGRTNWPTYIFPWAPGTTHTISAPATQTDSQGRQFRFVSWSNSKPASFSYVAGPAPGGSTVTATYQPVGKVTISSVPAGLTLQVDGADCTTPCISVKDAGATVIVSAPQMVSVSDQSRLIFQGWGDSVQTSRTIPVAADPKTYTAAYSTQNKLTVSATPPEGAAFVISPPAADAFYDAGSVVAISPKLALGFRVNRWTGDVSSAGSTVAITLNGPMVATLLLDRVPAIAGLGVRNAASGASSDGFAAGSLISIYGANLSADLVVGPNSPLVQVLDNVAVRVDDAFLPLAFVSPGQINAQLPGALSEGPHTLIVHWEGKAETSSQFVVARNAPGLFSSGPPERPIGLFLRADGTYVTEDHPATAGEVISLLGTGLGPYVQPPPDGFLLGDNAGYALVDAVEVAMGDSTSVKPLYAGRSGAAVGVDAVRFQLPAGTSTSSLIPVLIRINSKESNTVFLPVSQVQP